jgi:hypothetical protein
MKKSIRLCVPSLFSPTPGVIICVYSEMVKNLSILYRCYRQLWMVIGSDYIHAHIFVHIYNIIDFSCLMRNKQKTNSVDTPIKFSIYIYIYIHYYQMLALALF